MIGDDRGIGSLLLGATIIIIAVCIFVAIVPYIQQTVDAVPSESFCTRMDGRGYVFPYEEKAFSYCECQVVTQHIDRVTVKEPTGRIRDITNISANELSYYDKCRYRGASIEELVHYGRN
jgi:hypothetical protein